MVVRRECVTGVIVYLALILVVPSPQRWRSFFLWLFGREDFP